MNAIAQALSAALVEFVWQGLLAAFLLWTALFVLRNRSARARYAASCAALAVMAVLPVVTACLLFAAPVLVGQTPWSARVPLDPPAAMPGGPSTLAWASSLAHWMLPIWSLGVLLFSLRLVWAGRQISALRRRSKPAEAAVLTVVAALRERMKLAGPVRVLISAAADCPSVVGWIKPAVLLPTATVAGLTPQQLEAVLAHELAHILRYDYLVNMLQTVAETLLFYHPAVWWASARIRHERELCCDDLAVDSCGDALCFARALTRLERLRASPPRLALGSAGGSLMYRIQRLAGDAGWQRGPSKLPGVLALSLGLICFALNMQWARGQQPDAPAPEPGVRVDLRGASVIHRAEVEYPDAAIEKGVQGTVVLETTIDADGSVGDARVLSGPLELRRAALQSVLQWHFTRAAAGSTRQVSIAFQLPAEGGAARSAKRERDRVQARAQKQLAESMAEQAIILPSRPSADASELETEAKLLAEAMAKAGAEHDLASADLADSLARAAQTEDLEHRLQALSNHAAAVAGIDSALAAAQASQSAAIESRLAELQAELAGFHGGAMLAGHRLQSIDIQGLSAASRDELLTKLPVHVGDTLAEDSMEKVQQAVTQFDEHLGLSILTNREGQVEIRIAAP